MDYNAYSTKNQKENSVIIHISLGQEAQWVKIQIGYIINARPDIFVGTFLIDTASQKTNSNGVVAFTHRGVLPNWVK